MILASVRPVVSIFTANRGDFDTSICFSEDMQCKIVFGHLLMTSLAFGFDANEKGVPRVIEKSRTLSALIISQHQKVYTTFFAMHEPLCCYFLEGLK